MSFTRLITEYLVTIKLATLPSTTNTCLHSEQISQCLLLKSAQICSHAFRWLYGIFSPYVLHNILLVQRRMIIWKQTIFTQCVGRQVRIVVPLSKQNTTCYYPRILAHPVFIMTVSRGRGGGSAAGSIHRL